MKPLTGMFYSALERLTGKRTIDTLPPKFQLGVDRLRTAYSDEYLTAQLHGGPDYDAIGSAIGTLSRVPENTMGTTVDERIANIRLLVDQLKQKRP